MKKVNIDFDLDAVKAQIEEDNQMVESILEELFLSYPPPGEAPPAAATPWKIYKTGDRKTYPPKYGRYLVNRKGGQFRIEVWNNTGFSRDDSNIEFWAEVIPPYIN